MTRHRRNLWKQLLISILLIPVLPCFMWGPFTHPYVNWRALKKARERLDRGEFINKELLEACEGNEDEFVFGGNSADAISTDHVINGVCIYDYAHNAVPDTATGNPFFGYALINRWKKREQSGDPADPKELALACGWLGHQIADWYPHYACIKKGGVLSDTPETLADETNSYSGLADSHRVFGDLFYPSVLRTNTVIEHALIELFYDVVVVSEEKDKLFVNPHKGLEMFAGQEGNLLTETSETLRGSFIRIPPEHIPGLKKNFSEVIFFMRLLVEGIILHRPDLIEGIKLYCDDSYVEKSVDRVVDKMFCRTDEEIFALAQPGTNESYHISGPYTKNNTKTGTTLFQLIYDASKPLKAFEPEQLYEAISDPLNLMPDGWFVEDIARTLYKLIDDDIERFLDTKIFRSSFVEKNALVSFLVALLTQRKSPFDVALKSFRETAPPIVTLDVCETGIEPTPEDVLEMFRSRELKIRISPATCSDDDPEIVKAKSLDFSTLLFRIDGYDVTHRKDLFEVEEEYWTGETEGDGELLLNVKLLEKFGGEYHHIFVDIHDNSGVHARYLNLEVGGRELKALRETAAGKECI